MFKCENCEAMNCQERYKVQFCEDCKKYSGCKLICVCPTGEQVNYDEHCFEPKEEDGVMFEKKVKPILDKLWLKLATAFDYFDDNDVGMAKQKIKEAYELRESLYQAIEEGYQTLKNSRQLPCDVGDTLYYPIVGFNQIKKIVVTEDDLYKMCDMVKNGRAFFDRISAEEVIEEEEG